jgi:hypothetical protein
MNQVDKASLANTNQLNLMVSATGDLDHSPKQW